MRFWVTSFESLSENTELNWQKLYGILMSIQSFSFITGSPEITTQLVFKNHIVNLKLITWNHFPHRNHILSMLNAQSMRVCLQKAPATTLWGSDGVLKRTHCIEIIPKRFFVVDIRIAKVACSVMYCAPWWLYIHACCACLFPCFRIKFKLMHLQTAPNTYYNLKSFIFNSSILKLICVDVLKFARERAVKGCTENLDWLIQNYWTG